MKKFLKSLFVIALITTSLYSRSIEEIKEDGKIIIAVYENFPPYSFIQNNQPAGIDIELGKIVAKSLGVKPVWYFTGSDENLDDDLRNTLWKGNLIHKNKADMMFRIPYDYEYMRRTDISTGELQMERVTIKGPYQSEKWIIVAHKNKIPQIEDLGVFLEHKVGVELETLPDLHLSSYARGILRNNVKHYFKFNEAIEDFKNKKIDAITGLKTQLEYLLDFKNNKQNYTVTESILNMKSHWDLATATDSSFRALSYHIDGELDKAYKNGTIKKIFEKFNVTYLPPISKNQ